MKCDTCEQPIGFGDVKIFAGRTVCPGCFAVLNAGAAVSPTSPSESPQRTSESIPQPIHPIPKPDPAVSVSEKNGYCIASFGLGIAGMLCYQVGILPLLAIIFGWIGLATFKKGAQQNRWMGMTGLILGILYLIMNVAYWHFGGPG